VATTQPEAVEGLDTAKIGEWISTNVDGLQPPFEWTRLVGGHSNLTYRVDAAGSRRAVVRRGPLGELQPGAHDMAREFKVISALWPTDVPVAQPFGVCTDLDVTGAVFYVMGYADGRAMATTEQMEAWLPTEAERRTASESYVDVLASMHLLDVDAIGLGDLARKDDYVGRQLRAWYRSWTSSAGDTTDDDPRAHEIHDLLQATKPPDGVPRLVHGDYGFHNILVASGGPIAAVVDWEVCTLGDALSDLAYVLNRWATPGREIPGRTTMPAGFIDADELLARYRERTGADVSMLDYYITLNHWRSACIVQGVYTRYARGQKSSEGVDVEGFRASMEARLSQAAESAARIAR
jgi:aminoglycoside phosphotransferase (APT) family kinase protein